LAEPDLIDQAKRGDAKAFEELVRPCLDVAFRTAYLVTRDAEDARDATQTALIKAHGALGRFRSYEPFRPWFLAIVANEAKNLVRSRVRRRTDPWPATGEPADGDDDPLADVVARERSAWLVAHIDRLDTNDRIVIYSRYALDLTEQEMAAVLDCPRGTVKSRLHRAIGRLRARIEAEGHPEEERT
jgi:RNA polymerase sigma-70 factor (ECF subfamily)